jgi:predicted aldo/keto reductase-like oxidoreductase
MALYQSLEYFALINFSLPVSAVIVGMETIEQLEQNLTIAESFKPMTDEERLAFFEDIISLVRPDKMPWKAKDWNNPTEWTPRHRGEDNHS